MHLPPLVNPLTGRLVQDEAELAMIERILAVKTGAPPHRTDADRPDSHPAQMVTTAPNG